MSKASIRLVSTKAKSLQLQSLEDDSEETLHLGFEAKYSESQDTIFQIEFEIELRSKDAHMKVVFEAEFEVEGKIEGELKSSPFVRVNAPAIAYPFLRSFISTTLLQAGYVPVILPTINFTAFKESE